MTTAGNTPKYSAGKSSRFPSPTLLILAGAVLVIARLVLPYRDGLIFKGSISTVNSLCHSGAGAFALALRPSLQSSCNEADAWMTGLNIAAVAGLALAGFGGYLLWRARQSGAGQQATDL